MDQARAQARIKELSKDSINVSQGPEVARRMKQRKISWNEVLKVLQMGGLMEGPAIDQKGGWRCTVQRFAAGEKISVVVSIYDDGLVVITTF
jgi:hypothetical protein